MNRKSRQKLDGSKNKYRLQGGSQSILIFVILMIILGIIVIFDASVYQAYEVFHNRFYFIVLHLFWVIVGTAGAVLLYFWDYHKLSKIIIPLFVVNITLLTFVLIIGNTVNGSKRWFALGSVPIQPAEFVKLI